MSLPLAAAAPTGPSAAPTAQTARPSVGTTLENLSAGRLPVPTMTRARSLGASQLYTVPVRSEPPRCTVTLGVTPATGGATSVGVTGAVMPSAAAIDPATRW